MVLASLWLQRWPGEGELGVPRCLPPESISFAPLKHLFPKLSPKACPLLKQSKDVLGEGSQGVTPRTSVPF